MSTVKASPIYRPHEEAAARATLRGLASEGVWQALHGAHFELVSRGDFVNGRLHRPQAGSTDAMPLAILIHDLGEHAGENSDHAAADWCRSGVAIAQIDLPLHGHRASPKLSQRLIEGCERLADGVPLDLDTRALVEEFARQSVSDVLRTAEALAALPEVDATRVSFVGRGVGAWIAAWSAPFATGLQVCALAGGIGQLQDEDLDPVSNLRAFASEARTSGSIYLHEQRAVANGAPSPSQTALFSALPEPRQAIIVDPEGCSASGFSKPMADAIHAQLLA